MDKINTLFQQRSFQLLLFILGISLFNWPFLSILVGCSLRFSFWAIFSCWFFLVLLLIFLGRCLTGHTPPHSGKNRPQE